MQVIFDICIGDPKPCLRLNRLAATVLFSLEKKKRRTVFQTCRFARHLYIYQLNLYCLSIYVQTSKRRGRQTHYIWRLKFVISSRADPICEQNNVQYTYSNRKFDIIDFNKWLIRYIFNMHFYILNIRNYILNKSFYIISTQY